VQCLFRLALEDAAWVLWAAILVRLRAGDVCAALTGSKATSNRAVDSRFGADSAVFVAVAGGVSLVNRGAVEAADLVTVVVLLEKETSATVAFEAGCLAEVLGHLLVRRAAVAVLGVAVAANDVAGGLAAGIGEGDLAVGLTFDEVDAAVASESGGGTLAPHRVRSLLAVRLHCHTSGARHARCGQCFAANARRRRPRGRLVDSDTVSAARVGRFVGMFAAWAFATDAELAASG